MQRPDRTIDEVWRQCDAWSRSASRGKEVQERGRLWALALGVLGALLGALAAWAAGGADAPAPGLPGLTAQALSVAAALSLALAAFIGRELLTVERETGWARARMLSEALRRECWRCLVGTPPYDCPEAGNRLAERAREMTSNLGLHRDGVTASQDSTCPVVSRIEDYIVLRALEQQDYYERRATRYRAELTTLKRLAFVLGAIAVTLGALGAVPRMAAALGFIAVFTTAAGAVVAWIQAGRLAGVVGMYQDAASQLSLVVALWKDGEPARAGLDAAARARQEFQLVETCEAVMARENESWRAEWLSEEKVKEALSRVDAVARGNPDREAR